MSREKPWFRFYASEWRSDISVRTLSGLARCLWLEMLCIMHEATPYGYLIVAGTPVSNDDLAALAALPPNQIPGLLDELEKAGVLTRNRKGVIYSQRFLEDEARAINSSIGGKKAQKNRTNRGISTPQQVLEMTKENQATQSGAQSGAQSATPTKKEEREREYISPPISSLRSEIAPPLCDPEGLENSESLEKPPDPPIPKAAKRPSAKRSAAKPRTRIAETWTLPPEWRDWAWGRGLNEGEIEAEAESFLNRNLRDATAYADWFAAWRTWITNCLKWRKPPGGANNDRFANRMSSRQPSATTRDSAFDQVAAEFGNPDYLPRRPAPLRA